MEEFWITFRCKDLVCTGVGVHQYSRTASDLILLNRSTQWQELSPTIVLFGGAALHLEGFQQSCRQSNILVMDLLPSRFIAKLDRFHSRTRDPQPFCCECFGDNMGSVPSDLCLSSTTASSTSASQYLGVKITDDSICSGLI